MHHPNAAGVPVVPRWRPYAVAVTDGFRSVSGQFPFPRSITFFPDGLLARALGTERFVRYADVVRIRRVPLGVMLYWSKGPHRILVTSLHGSRFVMKRLVAGGMPQSLLDHEHE